ncbi:solute carrier family 22 member 20-like [Homarus americanus]|uniref:solute carrier family 22 member 20-like n=1 Tax=Homarus americanus TaxID=6706 RepID=UPI001C45136A|nr:solute carrier family 22 member 20-like [Homarus americanus]
MRAGNEYEPEQGWAWVWMGWNGLAPDSAHTCTKHRSLQLVTLDDFRPDTAATDSTVTDSTVTDSTAAVTDYTAVFADSTAAVNGVRMVVSVDGLLERLGSRYQFLVFLLLSSCFMYVALNHHLHNYYLATPPHHCKLPEGWKEEEALPAVLMAGPRQSGVLRVGYSRCRMYSDPQHHGKGTKPCVYGYVFTLDVAEWSIVAEWGLVCERVWIRHWVMTSYLIGLVIGGLIFGFLADRFGRRNLLVVSVATVGCLGLALHFVRRLIVFLSLRFIQAIFVQGVHVTSWTLAAELFPPKWRCRALVAGGMARPLGVAMGALVALMVQHWRAVQLAVSLPLLISLLYCWMIPESLRWLLTRGKTRRARQVAAQVARHNLLTLPPTAHAQMDHLAAHVYLDVPWGSLLTLFKTPRLRKKTP